MTPQFSLSDILAATANQFLSLGRKLTLNRLGKSTDLIDLQQEGVASFLVNTSLDSGWVSDQQIITDNLGVFTNTLGEVNVALPVVLIEGVLNGNNRVVIDKSTVDIGQLSRRNIARLIVNIASIAILEI